MKGWILSTAEFSASVPNLKEASESRGFKLIDINTIDIIIGEECDGTIRVNGEQLELPDFILLAFIGLNYRHLMILRHLSTNGVVCLNNAESVALATDKIHASQILAANGLPVAKTILCEKDKLDLSYLEEKFGYPMIFKVIDGAKGIGVFLIKNLDDANKAIQEIESDIFIAQEYISTSFGRDIRVLAFHGKVTMLYERNNTKNNDFRSNVEQGGEVIHLKSNARIDELAMEIYKATNIDFCGIDLLYNGDDYVICELNSVPGGLQRNTDPEVRNAFMAGIAKLVANTPTPRWKMKSDRKD